MKSQRPIYRKLKKGLTLMEMMVVMAISTIVCLVIISLFIITYRTLGTEMRQDEMNGGCTQILNSISNDIEVASSIAYSGSAAFTPPVSQSYTYPMNAQSQNITAIPAATKVLVLQVPAYDSNGIITNQGVLLYDYIGYSWSQAVGATPGTLIRTCIPAAGSSRAPFYGNIAGAGGCDISLAIQFHVPSNYGDIPGYAGKTYADNATNSKKQLLFQGNSPVIGLTNVDQVVLTTLASGSSWGQSISMQLTSSAALRNWGK